jgi:hypothetical protein
MSALLHNMSTPPRTEVQAEMRRIADRIVIFSLVHALIVRGFLEAPGAPEKLGKDVLLRITPTTCAKPIRARWPSPDDLFAQIGEPKPLPMEADFLIGRRVGGYADGWLLCPDPQIVAGVQARCSGDLYLSRRSPDLSWERLLSEPIAFDEPAVSALFP